MALLRGYVVDGQNKPVGEAWVGLFEPEGSFGKDEYSFGGLEPATRELRHLAIPSGKDEITFRGPELDSRKTDYATSDRFSLPGFPGMLFLDQTFTNGEGYFELMVQSNSTPFYLQSMSPDHACSAGGGPFRPGQGEIYLRLLSDPQSTVRSLNCAVIST